MNCYCKAIVIPTVGFSKAETNVAKPSEKLWIAIAIAVKIPVLLNFELLISEEFCFEFWLF